MKTPLGKKNKKYVQGIFNPKNPQKYKGSIPIIFRSRLELLSMRYLDNNTNILTWGSESVIIPYISPKDGRVHRYFVDLVASLKDRNDGKIKKLLIEIKPDKQTRPPSFSAKKKQSTMIYEKYQWAVNSAKWQSARDWCKKNGYTFLILSEKHLNSDK
jgi:hypothetical protein